MYTSISHERHEAREVLRVWDALAADMPNKRKITEMSGINASSFFEIPG
ncbi:MAG: hypothetical protein L7F77_06805 [Candidatus Magnetominusculus sp. LBB02]|nr:hypothetical protein [Candidatus Magnetominusculus sp. LBB02]